MTIELTSEHERMIERVMHAGVYPDAQHVISAALEALAEEIEQGAAEDDKRSAAIERLRTFGKTHGLSLGSMTLRQLREEARP